MGGVHRWATSLRRRGRSPSLRREASRRSSGGWPGRRGAGRLVRGRVPGAGGGLEAAPPDLQCWTFLPAPSPLALWSRRQAHETAIHRVDAELTAGRPMAAPVAVRAGLRRRRRRRAADRLRAAALRPRCAPTTPVTLGIRCTDDDAALGVSRSGPTASRRPAGRAGGVDADCTVRGAAGDLYLALWNRGRGDRCDRGRPRPCWTLFGEARAGALGLSVTAGRRPRAVRSGLGFDQRGLGPGQRAAAEQPVGDRAAGVQERGEPPHALLAAHARRAGAGSGRARSSSGRSRGPRAPRSGPASASRSSDSSSCSSALRSALVSRRRAARRRIRRGRSPRGRRGPHPGRPA